MTNTSTPEITLSRWTNPYSGQLRRYLDGWEQAIGLEIRRYHTGNVSSATLDGAHIAGPWWAEPLRRRAGEGGFAGTAGSLAGSVGTGAEGPPDRGRRSARHQG